MTSLGTQAVVGRVAAAMNVIETVAQDTTEPKGNLRNGKRRFQIINKPTDEASNAAARTYGGLGLQKAALILGSPSGLDRTDHSPSNAGSSTDDRSTCR